jgi:murein DD-endopeptidase MepM/ murein hydrolase activator NlpD
MAKIYDWSLDFFKVQEGDWFTVAFDEQEVDGKPIGIGTIHGVRFNYSGKDFYAIRHDLQGKPQYFTETGQAMRKRFLKAPLKFERITSPFSKRRFHPVQRVFKPHFGVDYAASTGTAIRTVGDGTVVDCGRRGGNGIWVKVNHGGGYETGYLHMSRMAKGMRRGMRVSQGQVIGYVGSTGLATGPHLCFRFWERGVQVNPKKIRTPQSAQMTKAQLPTYLPVRDKVVQELSSAIPAQASGKQQSQEKPQTSAFASPQGHP